MKRLLIVDDHPVFRKGLRQAFDELHEYDEIIEAGSGAEALDELAKSSFTLAVIDINLPDLGGLDIVESRAGLPGSPPFFILTMSANASLARKAFRIGAAGFASKNIGLATLSLALRLVAAGEIYVEAEILRDILTVDVLKLNVRQDFVQHVASLTGRERAVLDALLEGLGAKEVAARLGVSLRTAENYQSTVYTKLGARTAVDLVRVALGAGLSLPGL